MGVVVAHHDAKYDPANSVGKSKPQEEPKLLASTEVYVSLLTRCSLAHTPPKPFSTEPPIISPIMWAVSVNRYPQIHPANLAYSM